MFYVELIACIFGLLCVWLTVRQSIWCWPAGLVSAALYVWVFHHAKLYSDMLLHLFYVGMQFYGWYYWLTGGPLKGAVPVTRLQPGGLLACVAAAGAGTVCLGFVMHRYTDAALPYWDAAIFSLSLMAQFLSARKVLESWPFWTAVRAMAIFVCELRLLYVTTVLYGVQLVMAIVGWMTWQRSYRTGRGRYPASKGAEAIVTLRAPLQTAESKS